MPCSPQFATFAAVALAAASSAALAEAPDVRLLAQGLVSDAWRDRAAAEATLAELTTSDLPALEAALDDNCPARAQLADAVDALRARSMAEAREVVVPAGETDAADLAVVLAEQAGVALDVSPLLRGVRVTPSSPGPQPFWQAIADLAAEHGLDVSANAGGPRNLTATLVPSRDEDRQLAGPARVAGPALIVVRRVHRQTDIDFDITRPSRDAAVAGRVAHRVRYELEAVLEPRFQIGPRRFAVFFTRATDADGRSLLPRNADAAPPAEPTFAAMADADGAVDGARPATPQPFVAEATWSAGRLAFDLTIDPGDSVRSGDALTLAGHVEGRVGSDLHTAEATAGQPTVWLVAGEPMSVRLVAGGLESSGKATWQLLLRSGRQLDDDVRRIVADSLDGATVAVDGVALGRGGTRVDDDAGRLSIDLTFVGADPSAETVVATCEVPRRTTTLVLPFRFDGLPLP